MNATTARKLAEEMRAKGYTRTGFLRLAVASVREEYQDGSLSVAGAFDVLLLYVHAASDVWPEQVRS